MKQKGEKIHGEISRKTGSMTTFYYFSVYHQSGLQKTHIFKIIFLIYQNVPQMMAFYLMYMMVS